MFHCPATSDNNAYYLAPIDGETPTLAVFRFESSGYYVDAQVTEINLDTLTKIGNMDFEDIKKRIQHKEDSNKLIKLH